MVTFLESKFVKVLEKSIVFLYRRVVRKFGRIFFSKVLEEFCTEVGAGNSLIIAFVVIAFDKAAEIGQNTQMFTCTKDKVWPYGPYGPKFGLLSDTGKVEHPDSIYLEDRDHDDGTCEVRKCPNCGLVFHVELPD